ncbi:F-box/FBD/LRR-repeat protein At1g16930-like [Trifolium pratense]|uniref:F-box/FBD/LRR-repeat protein At1g16930-like n=1 Tax=Trifolium pratense TaxID=57577 RepID=UPI001E693B58|nr:F-box/FBD/LRR-repeat protein At1g16930-like [Trifolium pratense]
MKRGTHGHNREKNEDRLSDLPDGVLHHILSFSDAKQAVQSCILSKRWKNLWKTLPTLKLTSRQFTTRRAFTKFVSHILSHRDASTSLYTFDFHRAGFIAPQLLKRILKYAFSHNVQQLQINTSCRDLIFLPSFVSCHTLTSLNLCFNLYGVRTVFPNSLNLPALTNLCLQYFIFYVNDDGHVDPFSTLNRLNSLNIYHCMVRGNQTLCISNATLADLKINDDSYDGRMKFFELSTPSLCTFVYCGTPYQKLCGNLSNLSSVKHVEIIVAYCCNYIPKNTSLVLLNWLIELPNAESLTISLNTLKVLSLVPDLLKVEFPSLYCLKSLKVVKDPSSASIPEEIVNFLIQNAPSAKVDTLP